MPKLDVIVREFALDQGACAAGICTRETLNGGPPSTDLSYALTGAHSAVTFAVPIDQSLIDPYFSKKDHIKLEKATYRAYTVASGIALELATYLTMKGLPSTPVVANRHYRPEVPGGIVAMQPNLSHCYLAVRSGVGHFGWSGNVITRAGGSAVVLGSVVTTAQLSPTEPLPPGENYCDRCGLCVACCASGFISRAETTTVTLGGVEFSYSKRRAYYRCAYVCAGLTGLHPSGRWSTWSPGRFVIPKADEDCLPAFATVAHLYDRWPKIGGASTT